MTAPPPYPRIPHIAEGAGTRDDVKLAPGEAEGLLAGPTVVEEKLDGASVALWIENEIVRVSLRSGTTRDRAGQLGPLRAWAAERSDELRHLLEDDLALYAEWLLLAHRVTYDRLPSYLVGLDLWRPRTGFIGVGERNHRLGQARIAVPPELARGVLGSFERARRLIGPSHFADREMEGVVVRALDGRCPRIAKLLSPGFRQLADDAWRAGRPRNRLATRAAR